MTKRGDRSVVESEGRGNAETETETSKRRAEMPQCRMAVALQKGRKTSIRVNPAQISNVFGCKDDEFEGREERWLVGNGLGREAGEGVTKGKMQEEGGRAG